MLVENQGRLGVWNNVRLHLVEAAHMLGVRDYNPYYAGGTGTGLGPMDAYVDILAIEQVISGYRAEAKTLALKAEYRHGDDPDGSLSLSPTGQV